MSKISIYEVVPVPKLADKLVGTSVGGEPEDITYNFTLGELLNLFIPNIPGNTLQGVLDFGNTATQNINLTGIITTTTLNVGSTANILNSNLTGETHITGGLYDRLNSIGTAGQVLRSTGTKVEWYSIPNIIPTLQQVLAAGNTADINIILSSNIQALTATANNVVSNTSLSVNGTLKDKDALVGTAGQILSSTGTKVQWIDSSIYTATIPLIINSGTKNISIQQAGSTQGGYLSSADWINFDGKQGAINLTTIGSSGPSTLVGNIINVPNYTLAGLNGVPQTRTLSINGVTYDLSANRAWTIPAGGTVTSVAALTIGTTGTDLSSTVADSTTTPVITLNVPTASATNRGALSAADWTTFNNKQNALTNPITGTGTTNTLPKFTGASALGNSNITDTGSLITLGSNSYINGQLGIGTSSADGSIYITRNLTGSGGNPNGIYQNSTIQSDANGSAYVNRTLISTQAASFTLVNLNHYYAEQGTFGAGSSVTNQTGFFARASLIGATNNYGFRGAIPSGTNRWNIYMDGTANNYMAGDTGIGTASLGTATQLTIGGTKTAVSAIARGQLINSTLVASANNDVLIGLDINSTFTNGAFTGVTNLGIRTNSNVQLTSNGSNIIVAPNGAGATSESIQFNNGRANFGFDSVTSGALLSSATTRNITFAIGSTSMGRFFATTGNFTLQNGGTFTDAGFKLDVNGTARVSGVLTLSSTISNGTYTYTLPSATGTLALTSDIPTNPVGGTGTTNTLAKFTAASTIGNSNITDTGSLITLGSNTFVTNNLGLGNSSLTQYGFRNSLNITGAGNSTANYSDGQILSGVVGRASYYETFANTADAAFTNAALYHYRANQSTFGASSVVTNQYGYSVESTLIGATNNYGFFGNIPSGTNRWNLYMNGTANNYLAGSLGIGATALTGINLYVGKNITGATTSYGVVQNGTVQSGVTSTVYSFVSSTNTAASAFTLSNYYHFYASQNTIGSTSAVTNQYGFVVENTLTGATNNYGFYGNIPAAANRWNLYMNGTASNYMAGALGIGTTGLTGYNLRVSINPSAATAYGIMQDGVALSSVTASYHINRTLAQTQAATFTIPELVHYYATQGSFGAGSTVTNQYGFIAGGNLVGATSNFGFYGAINSGTNTWNLYMAGTAANYMAGSLGIGSTSLTGYTLRLSKSLTGSTSSFATRNEGVVLSDVTADAIGFRNDSNTQAAAFTLTNYWHFWARQGSIGAGSAITNQYGYVVDSNMIGATNNYAFQGNIPSGANRWNLYMAGTAANYMAGQTGIGTTTLGSYIFNVGGSVATLVNFNSTNASGFYTTYSASGVEKAYIGLGANTISGLAVSDFGIVGSANVVIASGSGGTETMRIDSTKRIGIGTGSSINASAKVQIDSTTSGFLPPRMTLAQRTAIGTPAAGLIVYQTDGVEGLWLNTSTGWRELTVV